MEGRTMQGYTIHALDQEGCTLSRKDDWTHNKREAISVAKTTLADQDFIAAGLDTVQVLKDDVVEWDGFVRP